MMDSDFQEYCKNNSKFLATTSNNETLSVLFVPNLLLVTIKKELINLFDKLHDINFGKQTSDDIFNLCLKNQYTVWCFLLEDKLIGVATTEVKNYPKATSFYISNISVDNNMFIPNRIQFYNFFENTAKEFECDILEFRGRVGWHRYTKFERYTAESFIYSKRIKDTQVV